MVHLKNLFIAGLISILFLTQGFSQNLLNCQWQFCTGDSMIWKETSYNSSNWKSIKSGRIWEDQGFGNYDGYAWYRKTIVIPEEIKKEAIKFGGMNLNLGTIDDADQIYFNGKLLGETGHMPPHYVGAYDKIRNFDIKVEDILWGKENLIAVRVYDAGGGGGITGQEVSFKVKGLDSYFSIQAQFPHENHIFTNTEKVSFNLLLDNTSNSKIDGKINYLLINDFKDTVAVWSEIVKIPAKKKITEQVDKDKLPAGFYTLFVDMESKLINQSKSYCFGVDPEKIVSPSDRQADFDNFWQRSKQELAAIEPQYKLIKIDSLCTLTRDVYLVEMRSMYNVLIRGWYARPKTAGKFPAILHVQGYSSDAQMSWGYPGDDMVVFVLNIRGHGNSRDEINPGFPGYLTNNLKDPERYIYRGAYMDCIRAVDFLYSRDEVDNRYIVVEGGSQGGALSFATAALDNQRISLCIPAVPFLSDFPDYFKVANWPANEFVDFEKQNKSFGWNGIFKTLSYFDIKNLAGWVRCPVFMAIGLKDNVCPPHINFAAYNKLNGPKSYFVFPEAGHGLPSEHSIMKYEWMKKQLTILKNTK